MIYFIQNTRTKDVKIGTSTDPEKRIASFQTAIADELEILGTIPGDRHVERRLHIRFSGFHIRGEWFRGDEKLVSDIRGIIDALAGRPNLWEAIQNRDYNVSGLVGLQVVRIGEQFPSVVRAIRWRTAPDPPLVQLADSREIPADCFVLRDIWPDWFVWSCPEPVAVRWKQEKLASVQGGFKPRGMDDDAFAEILIEAGEFIARRLAEYQVRNGADDITEGLRIECGNLSQSLGSEPVWSFD